MDRKIGFLKKIWYSIAKIEKYPDIAAEGLKKAVEYLLGIVAIVAIVMSFRYMYKTYEILQHGVNYLENGAPEFSYKDGILNVETENEIIFSDDDNPFIGETIIDTKTDDEQQINKYTNSISQNGRGMVILKDKVIIKNSNVSGTITYLYNEIFAQMQISQFNKQSLINDIHSSKMINVYISIFLTVFMMSFLIYLLTIIPNTLIVSCFGYITTLLARIKMRYVAIFNMSIYSLTLSSFLNLLYILVNTFTDFNMTYFNVMYMSVAVIYLVAAIFILKSDLIKKQMDLIKLAEAEAIIKKEQEDKEQEEKDEKEREERKEKDKEENDVGDNEPEGSNA